MNASRILPFLIVIKEDSFSIHEFCTQHKKTLKFLSFRMHLKFLKSCLLSAKEKSKTTVGFVTFAMREDCLSALETPLYLGKWFFYSIFEERRDCFLDFVF